MRQGYPLPVLLLIVVLAVLATTFSCSDNSVEPGIPVETDYSRLLEHVSFIPNAGAPGTIVEIRGLDSLPSPGQWSLQVGEGPVPLIADDIAGYATTVPLIFSVTDSTWPIASATPLDVTLYRDGNPVDTAFGQITIDSLPHADGAVDTLIQDLMTGANALRQIGMSLGIDDTLMQAVCLSMEEILISGDNSLNAILAGTSPIVGGEPTPVDLLSALVVTTGTSELISNWSDTLQSLQEHAASSAATGMDLALVDDEGLAYRMQMYSLLREFSETTVGATALTWNSVAAVLGGAGIAFPPLGYIEFIFSFAVAELDFMFNKIALALLPAEITELSLDFHDHTVLVGDTTQAIVMISAKNNPPNITPLDIVMQVVGAISLADWLSSIGVARSYLPANIDEIITGLTTWYIGVINNVLSTQFNAPTMIDLSLPIVTYDSIRVEHPDLIDLVSPNLSRISPLTGSINGLAGDSTGPVPLTVRTQPPGPNTLIHPILASAGYAGGAFGDELVVSNVDTVTVAPDMILQVDFPDTVSFEGAGALGVDAGYIGAAGDTVWMDGVNLSIYVTGGHAESSTGLTDIAGHFGTVIHHDSAGYEIEIRVYAVGDDGSNTDTSVTAFVPTIALEASFPDTLVTLTSGELQIRAGYVVAGGDIDWTEGIDITLSVSGGNAASPPGATDVAGRFQTIVTSDGSPSPMTIDIAAQGASGSFADTTIVVVIDTAGLGGHSMEVTRCQAGASASVGVSAYESGIGSLYHDDFDYEQLDDISPLSATATMSLADTGDDSCSAGASCNANSAITSLVIDPVSGDLVSFGGTGGASASGTASQCGFAEASAGDAISVSFTIYEGLYEYSASGSVTFNGEASCGYVGPTGEGSDEVTGSISDSGVLGPGSYQVEASGMAWVNTYLGQLEGEYGWLLSFTLTPVTR